MLGDHHRHFTRFLVRLVYRALLLDPLLTRFNLANTLDRSIPLIFTGLSVAVVFQMRIYSLGAEGQLYLGALAGTLVALFLPLPRLLVIPLMLAAAAVTGALYSMLAGYLKARFGADEIVSTLMLNVVAVQLVSFTLSDWLRDKDSGYVQTVTFPEPTWLLRLIPQTRVHTGLILAILAAVLVYLFLYRTTYGYELRMTGHNPGFAEYGGMSSWRTTLIAFALAGALAGLAGMVETAGIHRKLIDRFSPGYGFDGIVVAILGRNHPLSVPFSALFYAYLRTGAQVMERTSDVSRELVSVVQAVLILFVTAQAVIAWLERLRKRKVEADA